MTQIVIVQQNPIVQIRHVGIQGPPGIAERFKHEPRYLTALEASQNKLTLLEIADEHSIVILNVFGAPPQMRNIDYEYNPIENSISWGGLGLDSFLEENELVEIIYRPL